MKTLSVLSRYHLIGTDVWLGRRMAFPPEELETYTCGGSCASIESVLLSWNCLTRKMLTEGFGSFLLQLPTNIFTAIVNFRWLKGKREDPKIFKKITMRLLPVELALEDTLRQLLILTLSEGSLDDFSTWEDLERLELVPGSPGIAINKSRNGNPITYSVTSIGKGEAATKPMFANSLARTTRW